MSTQQAQYKAQTLCAGNNIDVCIKREDIAVAYIQCPVLPKQQSLVYEKDNQVFAVSIAQETPQLTLDDKLQLQHVVNYCNSFQDCTILAGGEITHYINQHYEVVIQIDKVDVCAVSYYPIVSQGEGGEVSYDLTIQGVERFIKVLIPNFNIDWECSVFLYSIISPFLSYLPIKYQQSSHIQ